jgi:RNA polymerase sigma factor (sigma-70 family)
MSVKASLPFRPVRQLVRTRPSGRRVDPLATLARAASAGDEPAVNRLLRALAPDVLRVVRAVLGPAHSDLEYLVEECLVDVVRELDEFRYDSTVSRFALSITFRRAFATQRRERDSARWMDDFQCVDEPFGCGASAPVDNVAVERRRALVAGLLAILPEAEAEAFGLRMVVGLSIEEIARTTGVPATTARGRLRIAKESLCRAIEADPALYDLVGPLR